MPTYVYRCKRCMRAEDVVQSIKDKLPAKRMCKDCKVKSMEHVIEASPVHFKGYGWTEKG